MKRILAVAVVLAATSIGAEAKPGQCLLEIKSAPKLLGRCNVEMQGDGSFSIGTATRPSDLTYFATVDVEPDGSASGYWNGAKGVSHAHEGLGPLTRKGACWENEKARVCAWK